MTLRQKQSEFARMVAKLIWHAGYLGYEVTLGIADSLHCDRLAIDLNLFRDGKYLRSTESHRPLGEWWESIGGSWGGRFGDGNHYSLAGPGRGAARRGQAWRGTAGPGRATQGKEK